MLETEQILKAIQELRTELRTELRAELRTELRTELRAEIKILSDRLDAETKKWDERFFQLSKDTLGFTRTVITTAAIVAVLTPVLVKVLDSPILAKLIDQLLTSK